MSSALPPSLSKFGQRYPPPNLSKRRLCPWINNCIVVASESGNLSEVMTVITVYLKQMNLVNLSTACHRIARLTGDNRKVQLELRQSKILNELLDTVSRALKRCDAQCGKPQSLSNIAWSLATIRHVDLDLCQTVSELSVANMASFKPFELSNILWAFAKLGTVDSTVWSASLFHAAPPYIVNSVDLFEFRCLSMTVWAYATARHPHNQMFSAIARQMLPMVHVANCQEMANTVWAFGTIGFHSTVLFDSIAEHASQKLDEFKPKELSSILWGFATNEFLHPIFYRNASVVANNMDLQSQHLANILWSFARVLPRHAVTEHTFLRLLPRCTQQLDLFKPQEVSSTVIGVAKVFDEVSEELGKRQHGPDSTSETRRITALPKEVLQFLQAVMRWTVNHIQDCPDQSLANTSRALSMVPGFVDVECLNAIKREALIRCKTMEPAVLLQLLKALVGGHSEQSMEVIRCICERMAGAVSGLSLREVKFLSTVYVDLTGHQLHQLDDRAELAHALFEFAHMSGPYALLDDEGETTSEGPWPQHFSDSSDRSTQTSNGLCAFNETPVCQHAPAPHQVPVPKLGAETFFDVSPDDSSSLEGKCWTL